MDSQTQMKKIVADAAIKEVKRADELRRQQEKQLANLQKQAEEATKYKNISDEIKKIEAGLYYLKLLEIKFLIFSISFFNLFFDMSKSSLDCFSVS